LEDLQTALFSSNDEEKMTPSSMIKDSTFGLTVAAAAADNEDSLQSIDVVLCSSSSCTNLSGESELQLRTFACGARAALQGGQPVKLRTGWQATKFAAVAQQ
jgi:hypothetical protein